MNLVWDERLKRFRDPKTGRIVKRGTTAAVTSKSKSPNRWNPFEHREGEFLEAVCERCGRNFQVLYDWRWDDPPKHFYCSRECYLQAMGYEEQEVPSQTHSLRDRRKHE